MMIDDDWWLMASSKPIIDDSLIDELKQWMWIIVNWRETQRMSLANSKLQRFRTQFEVHNVAGYESHILL